MPRRDPRSPISTAYSTSTDLSPPFTYSITRPPTTFSEIAFDNISKSPKSPKSPGKSPYPPPRIPLPPIPNTPVSESSSRRTNDVNVYSPFGDDSEVDTDAENTGDLHHRSDRWSNLGIIQIEENQDEDDQVESVGPETCQSSGKFSEKSRTSYKPSSRPPLPRHNTDISESPTFKSTYITPNTTKKVQFIDRQSMNSISPRYSCKSDYTSLPNTAIPCNNTNNQIEKVAYKPRRQSTLPSILSLSNLIQPKFTKFSNEPPRHIDEVEVENNVIMIPSLTSTPDTEFLPFNANQDFKHKVNGNFKNEKGGSGEQDVYHRKPYDRSKTPDITRQQNQNQKKKDQKSETAKLIQPKDQIKLGRMSVAPARYTLPPQRKSRIINQGAIASSTGLDKRRDKENIKKSNAMVNMMNRLKHSSLIRFYLIYKPFISCILSLTCALILTVSNGLNNDSKIVQLLLIKKDVFDISIAGNTDFALGVWGWCQMKNDHHAKEPQCGSYGYRDFANDNLSFTIPGNSTLDTLSSFSTALTVLIWLLSLYQIVKAFLHFYLFFALSIPFDHLVEIRCKNYLTKHDKPESRSKQKLKVEKQPNKDEDESVVAEVDIRVKCERFPYQNYQWVWWAWWGHNKSPLESVFANLVGILCIITFAFTLKFKSNIVNATGSDRVSLRPGAYMSLLTLILTLDNFMLSFKYFWNFKYHFKIFLNPPSPSARVLLLPESENNLTFKHYKRRTGLQSFFAPISAKTEFTDQFILNGNNNDTNHNNNENNTYLDNPNNHIVQLINTETEIELDEETIRWLRLYPEDSELVLLISSLKRKKQQQQQQTPNHDFLLSDIGLLYLRPNSFILSCSDNNNQEEHNINALLIPPKGIIREELLEDSHLNFDSESNNEKHNDLDTMINILLKSFWWNGLEIDCKEYIENCKICFENLREQRGNINKEFHLM
ncbi:uncharacterized protein L201_000582 [Kwoniella dendrophila CBS 6074]|uniref:Integrase zinc-binding domain-containing protein n=1 Tax=Kwoniella dendrophila CBS 6074 TaxID=1295534 RepID=A0AAX4JL45_9TREE